MHLILHDSRLGPKPSGPVTEDSIRRAKAAAQAELERDNLEQFVGEDGRVHVRVAVQTYGERKSVFAGGSSQPVSGPCAS